MTWGKFLIPALLNLAIVSCDAVKLGIKRLLLVGWLWPLAGVGCVCSANPFSVRASGLMKIHNTEMASSRRPLSWSCPSPSSPAEGALNPSTPSRWEGSITGNACFPYTGSGLQPRDRRLA